MGTMTSAPLSFRRTSLIRHSALLSACAASTNYMHVAYSLRHETLPGHTLSSEQCRHALMFANVTQQALTSGGQGSRANDGACKMHSVGIVLSDLKIQIILERTKMFDMVFSLCQSSNHNSPPYNYLLMRSGIFL